MNFSGSFNNSFALFSKSQSLIVIETLIFIGLDVAAFVGNVLICLAFCRNRQLLTTTNVFILSLALTDLFQSLFVMPFSVGASAVQSWIFGHFGCQFMEILGYILAGVSIETLTVIALNRYLCVARPLLYRRVFTKRRATIIAVATWTGTASYLGFGIPFSGIEFRPSPTNVVCAPFPKDHNVSLLKLVVLLFYALMFLIASMIIPICYVKVYLAFRRHNAKVASSLQTTRSVRSSCINGSGITFGKQDSVDTANVNVTFNNQDHVGSVVINVTNAQQDSVSTAYGNVAVNIQHDTVGFTNESASGNTNDTAIIDNCNTSIDCNVKDNPDVGTNATAASFLANADNNGIVDDVFVSVEVADRSKPDSFNEINATCATRSHPVAAEVGNKSQTVKSSVDAFNYGFFTNSVSYSVKNIANNSTKSSNNPVDFIVNANKEVASDKNATASNNKVNIASDFIETDADTHCITNRPTIAVVCDKVSPVAKTNSFPNTASIAVATTDQNQNSAKRVSNYVGRSLMSSNTSTRPKILRHGAMKEAKMTKILAVTVVGFYMCWLPALLYGLLYLFGAFGKDGSSSYLYSNFLYTFPVYMSSTINPLIYVKMNKTFRDVFYKLVCCERI